MADVLSDDEFNGLKLCYVVEKSNQTLRYKFHIYYPTNQRELYERLSKEKDKIDKLLAKNIICQEQVDILLPENGSTDSSKFDLTLLTLLLREFCHIKQPVNGWINCPPISDQSVSASLVRLRLVRKKFKNGNWRFNQATFTNIWNEFCVPLVALGCNKDELVRLKEMVLEPGCLKKFQNIQTKLGRILESVSDLEEALEEGITYNVLPPTPSYVEKADFIEDIHNQLRVMSKYKLAFVLNGCAGTGKTELVRQYCKKYMKYYRKNVIWINAEQEHTITEDFIKLSEQIKLTIKDESNHFIPIKDIIEKVIRFFSERPVLFVLDNVQATTNAIRNVINAPGLCRSKVIIITQSVDWDQRFIQQKVDVLTEESAMEYFLKTLPYAESNESIQRLIETVQHLPLVLKHVVAYITHIGCTIEDYIKEFEKVSDHLKYAVDIDKMHMQILDTTCQMAIEKMKDENNGELVTNLLGMMSLLDGTGINKKFFNERFNKEDVDNALDILEKYFLISIFHNNLEEIITMHPLVQLIIKTLPRYKDEIFLKMLLDLMLKSNIIEQERLDWQTSAKTESSHSQLDIDYGNHWYHLVYMFYKEKYKSEALVFGVYDNIQTVFKVFEARGKLDTLNKVISELCKLRKWEPVKQCELDSYFVKSLISLNRYDEALKKLNHVQKFKTEILPDNEQSLLQTKQQIAYCLAKKGCISESLESLKIVEKRQLDLLKPKHPDILETKECMSFCFMEMGKYDAALEILSEVEATRLNDLERKYDVSSTQSKIAKCLEMLGELDLAVEKYLDVESSQKKVFANSDPRLLSTQFSIASCLHRQGNDEVALEKYLEVEKSLVKTHPKLLTTKQNIAACLHGLGKLQLELEKYTEIELAEAEMYEINHPALLTTKQKIGHCLIEQEKYGLALEKYLEIEKLETELFGSQHASSMVTELNIAHCLRGDRKFDLALSKYLSILHSKLKFVGNDHPSLLTVHQNIAHCMEQQGDVDLALELYLQVERSGLKLLDSSHPLLLTTQHSIASCLQKQGKLDRALDKYLKVEISRMDTLGSKHIDLLTTQYNLANCWIEIGNLDMALDKLLHLMDSLNGIDTQSDSTACPFMKLKMSTKDGLDKCTSEMNI